MSTKTKLQNYKSQKNKLTETVLLLIIPRDYDQKPECIMEMSNGTKYNIILLYYTQWLITNNYYRAHWLAGGGNVALNMIFGYS